MSRKQKAAIRRRKEQSRLRRRRRRLMRRVRRRLLGSQQIVGQPIMADVMAMIRLLEQDRASGPYQLIISKKMRGRLGKATAAALEVRARNKGARKGRA